MAFVDGFIAGIAPVSDALRKLDSAARAASQGHFSDDQAQATLASFLKSLRDAVSELANMLPQAGQTTVEFADFFHSIGSAVANAQRELDLTSADYIQSRTSLAAPTVFRIPRVSASMKFSLARKDSEKINLIFYSSGKEAQEEHQQSVTFDIVAVPPSPDYTPPVPEPVRDLARHRAPTSPQARATSMAERAGTLESPSLAEPGDQGLLAAHLRVAAAVEEATQEESRAERGPTVDAALRRHLFEHVASSLPVTGAGDVDMRKGALTRNPARVIIVPDPDGQSFLLLVAGKGPRGELNAWRLVPAGHTLEVILAWPSRVTERRPLEALRALVAAMGDRQARRRATRD